MFSISEQVRATAREWPMPYKVWSKRHSRRMGKKIKLPEPTDRLYLDGYPRSGNTYFTSLVTELEPQIEFANDLHVVAPIRIALGLKIPTFILMRKPEDTILSHLVHIEQFGGKSGRSNRNLNKLASSLINDWLRYYQFVDSNCKRLTVIVSEEAFKDPLKALEAIFDLAGVPQDPRRSAKYKKADALFAARDATKAQGSTSYPSAERDRMKGWYRSVIEESGRVAEARALYGEIAARILSEPNQRLS